MKKIIAARIFHIQTDVAVNIWTYLKIQYLIKIDNTKKDDINTN